MIVPCFVFEGFLPVKSHARRKKLLTYAQLMERHSLESVGRDTDYHSVALSLRKSVESLKDETRTIIFYESPYRLLKTLLDIKEVLDDPVVVCVREISKKFEEVKKGKAGELLQHFKIHRPRGEFVLLVRKIEPRGIFLRKPG